MLGIHKNSRTAVRSLAWLTLALYAVVVALLALTTDFPTWGEDPKSDYDFYLPPQFTVAVYVTLAAFAVSALIGVVCAVTSRSAGQDGWATTFAITTALAMQGPFFIGIEIYSRLHISLPPDLEVVCVLVSVAAFLAIPALALVFARSARTGSM